MENPIKMEDLGGFTTPIFGNTHFASNPSEGLDPSNIQKMCHSTHPQDAKVP